MLAEGTKFMFMVALAILKLVQHELLELDFGEINEYFKTFKDQEDTGAFKLLPDFEKIISEAYKIKLTDERIDELLAAQQGPEPAEPVASEASQVKKASKPKNLTTNKMIQKSREDIEEPIHVGRELQRKSSKAVISEESKDP